MPHRAAPEHRRIYVSIDDTTGIAKGAPASCGERLLLCCEALLVLPTRYEALRNYTHLDSFKPSLKRGARYDWEVLWALCLAYRTETGSLKEGAFHLLIVALGDALLRLAPLAQNAGEILEALWVAASQPGAPLLLAIRRDLLNFQRKERRRLQYEELSPHLLEVPIEPPPTDPLLRRPINQVLSRLTPHERQLMRWLGEGKKPLEIFHLLLPQEETLTHTLTCRRIQRLKYKLQRLGLQRFFFRVSLE